MAATLYIVHLTTDTIRGILLEKSRHPRKECIVQMAGVRKGKHFYFDLVSDSGMNAIYEEMMCEKDHAYMDHLTTRLSEYYEIPKGQLTVSLLHFHPAGVNRFSAGDRALNRSVAQSYGGAVMGLGFVDPKFRIKFWYIDEDGREYETKIVIDNEGVKAAMPKKDLQGLKKLVEERETFSKRLPNILELYPKFNNELLEISKQDEIFIEKNTDNSLQISIKITDKENFTFQAMKEWHRLFLVMQGKKQLYRKGVIEEMLREEKREYIRKQLEEWQEKNTAYTVYLPQEYKDEKYEGMLDGFMHDDAKTFNVIHHEIKEKLQGTMPMGYIAGENFPEPAFAIQNSLVGRWKENGELVMCIAGKENPIDVQFYSYHNEAFSRNESIVESDVMKNKQAIIPGVGSGGSFIALELAKAGIGSLIIADDDKFAYHNISRHQCGIHDVGKFKVDAMKERILDINPYCEVHTFTEVIQRVDPKKLRDVIWNNSIIICSADNRHAAYECNALAKEFKIPMIDAGCVTRASMGEIFYWKPGMPMYEDAYGPDTGIDRENQEMRRLYYATEQELEKMDFQPGMSLDIVLTSVAATKLAIDLLMEKEEGYEPKLLSYVKQITQMINYPIDEELNPYMTLFTDKRPFVWLTGDVVKGEAAC